MSKAIYPRNLRVGDQSGSSTLISKSEYNPDTMGYITTWSTPKGLQVSFLRWCDYIGIDYLAKV